MDTIGMDTYGLVAGVADPTANPLRRRDRALRPRSGGATRCNDRFSARGGQANDGEKSDLHPACERPFAAR